MKGHWWLSS